MFPRENWNWPRSFLTMLGISNWSEERHSYFFFISIKAHRNYLVISHEINSFFNGFQGFGAAFSQTDKK